MRCVIGVSWWASRRGCMSGVRRARGRWGASRGCVGCGRSAIRGGRRRARWPAITGPGAAGCSRRGLAVDRPPLELSLTERVEAARRLHATGMTSGAIARELDVDARTVRRYLRASVCECGEGYVVRGAVCQACAQELAVRRADWTAQEVSDAIGRWARLEGAPPSIADWRAGASRAGKVAARVSAVAGGARRGAVVRELERGACGRGFCCAAGGVH